MNKTFQTRIKHKRDSQANWETNNPVLLEGELGIVVMPDGKIKTKIGDGVTNYKLLPFSSSDVELIWDNIEDKPENLAYLSDDSTEIKTLTDNSGAIVYPRTKAEAVYGLENIDERVEELEAQLDNKSNSGHKHAAEDITSGTVAITRGGTGAADRINAFNNILSLGVNPITSTSDDTTSKWSSLGSGIAWFDIPECLNDQPGQWGFVINYVWGSDVFQIWYTQNAGPMLLRSGNAGGWSETWRKVYEQKNITISTSAPSGGANGDIWIQYE